MSALSCEVHAMALLEWLSCCRACMWKTCGPCPAAERRLSRPPSYPASANHCLPAGAAGSPASLRRAVGRLLGSSVAA